MLPASRTTLCLILMLILQSGYGVTRNGFDLSDSLIPVEKIESGGPPRDGIPSIDDPKFLSAGEAKFLKDRDQVIGLYRNGVAKAYPIRILNWHEIVNDQFKDEAVVVSFCPLCNTGMAFTVENPNMDFTFGVSGLLYNSDVLLYDRQTGSLWSQIMGKAVSGPLKGLTLPLLSSRHTTWRDWREQYPETLVLSRDTGFRRDYKKSPYLDYSKSEQLFFRVEHENKEYRRKELVLGVSVGERHKAYPFSELARVDSASFQDDFAGRELTVTYSKPDKAAHLVSQDGEEFPSVLAYWFAWYAFHPDTEIFRGTR